MEIGFVFISLISALTLALCAMALSLPLGTILEPGPGLFPFAISLALSVVAMIVAVREYRGNGAQTAALGHFHYRPLLLFLFGGISAALLVDLAGFPATTFLAIFLMLWAPFQIGLARSLLIAIAVTAVATVLFRTLGIALPLIPYWFR